jgi:phosphatidylglycerol:prolipoprotein diacylglycerol transferase
MEDSSHVWRQPTFFYEQIGNIIGLFLIYFVSEIIKSNRIRKAGTLAISYFLWYGIVRIIMTPLRMQGSASGGSGGEEMNLIITICWIVFAFIFLLLNTFIFPKYLRNKRVIYLSFISITFFFKRFFRKNNNILINKYHNDKKKFIREENEIFWYNNF